nr:hypothetical protein CPGR_02361 [Mycolicibacterium malmesburyense]
MRDVHQRHLVAPGQSGQHRHQALAALLVDHAGDLVGDQQRRFARQRRCDGEPLQFAPGQPAGVAFGQAVEADLGEQLAHVGGLARRQPPDHVVGDAGPEHLALGVLHHDRGAADAAQSDRAGPFDGARCRLAPGEHQHQRRLARAVGARHREVLAGFHAQRHRAERVVVGPRIAEPHVAQPRGHRGDGADILRRLQLVDVGDAGQALHHPRQGPPPDEADEGDRHHAGAEEQQRPVVQRRGEVALEPVGRALHVRDAGDHRGEAVDVGGDRFEDQVTQPRQDGQRHHYRRAEHRPGDQRGEQDRRGAAAAPFDDSGQPADIGAVEDGHEPAHARDQKRDDAARDGRREQDPQPVAVGQQAHRHRAEQGQPGRERYDHGDDGGGRAQRRHDGGLGEFDGTQMTGVAYFAPGRGHCTILPVAIGQVPRRWPSLV